MKGYFGFKAFYELFLETFKQEQYDKWYVKI